MNSLNRHSLASHHAQKHSRLLHSGFSLMILHLGNFLLHYRLLYLNSIGTRNWATCFLGIGSWWTSTLQIMLRCRICYPMCLVYLGMCIELMRSSSQSYWSLFRTSFDYTDHDTDLDVIRRLRYLRPTFELRQAYQYSNPVCLQTWAPSRILIHEHY